MVLVLSAGKADGVSIDGATANVFTLTQSEVGKSITVDVIATWMPLKQNQPLKR